MRLFQRLSYLLFMVSSLVYGQQGGIDVQHYNCDITVNDANDIIVGTTKVAIVFNKPLSSFSLDLINKNPEGKGMSVTKVLEDDKEVPYAHNNDKLVIDTDVLEVGERRTFSIEYAGVPADGLIISKNKYGDRTFFGDNWPNRARNWIPCVDHPSDKALMTFLVRAPSAYQVIGNGMLTEETDLSDGNTLYKWETNVAIPTKVAVIGIAKFAVQYLGETRNIPISSWVYPQNKTEGFYDYALAKRVLEYFIDHVGPYPYQKLSNVQSKTRFGGMENAGNIFYFEGSVTGKRQHEALIAHEIAHQWFGNSATESDWPHIWLSEGFATYFTNLYMQHMHGTDGFRQRLATQRDKIIAFSKKRSAPVVDTQTKDYMQLLNPNSYEKGGWVLHMLRKKLGDELFWKGIKHYYQKYELSNASTADLRTVFEEVSGQDLKPFFKQWLYTAGHPELSISRKVKGNTASISVLQKQASKTMFSFSLEVKIVYNDGTSEIKSMEITKKKQMFTLSGASQIKEVHIDPDVWLLFEQVD